jgi:hypothetical protein
MRITKQMVGWIGTVLGAVMTLVSSFFNVQDAVALGLSYNTWLTIGLRTLISSKG